MRRVDRAVELLDTARIFIVGSAGNLARPEHVVGDQKAAASQAWQCTAKGFGILMFVHINENDVELARRLPEEFQRVSDEHLHPSCDSCARDKFLRSAGF